MKDADPTLSMRDVARELGRRWNELSPADKAPFKELAARNLKVFTDQKRSDKNIRRTEVETIKKPKNSFMHFSEKERSNIVFSSIAELGRELGKRWRNLGKEERADYELLAREDLMSYEIQLEQRQAEERVQREQELVEGRGNESSVSEPSIGPLSVQGCSAADLGFAKTKGYPFHPAVRTGTIGQGSRSLVT